MTDQVADRLSVTVNGQPREVFMSFGILNALVAAIGDVEKVGLVAVDPELRLSIIGVLLAERDEKGKVSKPFDLEADQISIADANAVLEWAGDHVLDFFMQAAETQARLLQKNQQRMQKLNSIVSPAG